MLNPLLKPSKNTSPKWAKLSVLTKMASKRCALRTLCPATSSKFPVRKSSLFMTSTFGLCPASVLLHWCHCLRAELFACCYGPLALQDRVAKQNFLVDIFSFILLHYARFLHWLVVQESETGTWQTCFLPLKTRLNSISRVLSFHKKLVKWQISLVQL